MFYLIPMLDSFRYTFTEGVAEKHFTGMKNFQELFQNPAFRQAISNTFCFMLLGVPLIMVLSMAISYLLQDGTYKMVRVMLLIPLIIPSSAYLPGLVEIFKEDGMLNHIASIFGLESVAYMTDHAMAVLIFVYILKNIGYLTVVLCGGMEGIAKEYREVWLLESRAGIRYLIKVVIPIILPTVFFAGLLALMGCLKIFREAYLLYGDSPPMSVYLLQHFMNNNFYKLNFQRLSGAAFLVVSVLIIFIILFLYMQNQVRKRDL